MRGDKMILKGVLAELALESNREMVNAVLRPPVLSTNTAPCECEHISHFWEENKLTPLGEIGHPFGMKFFDKHLHQVRTPDGTFFICTRCKDDCFRDAINRAI